MNRDGERQHNFATIKCDNNRTLWNYLVHRTDGVVDKVTIPSTGIIRGSTLKGCTRNANRVGKGKNTYLLRFETKAQLSCLRKILGISTTIGIRKRRPKLNTEDTIEPLSKLNIILGKEREDETMASTRIDLYMNKFETFICLHYNAYILSAGSRRLTHTTTHENIIEDEYIQFILSAEYTENF